MKAELANSKSSLKLQQSEITFLKAEVAKTKSLLTEEKENNIARENYTRRENLKFI